MHKIFLLRIFVSLVGFLATGLALRGEDVIYKFVLYSPLGIIIIALIDRGRGEFALRNGIGLKGYVTLRHNIYKMIGLILVVLPFGIFFVAKESGEYIFALIIIVFQAIAMGWGDILIRAKIYANSSINALLKYQFLTAILFLIGVSLYRSGLCSAQISLSIIVCGPLIALLFTTKINEALVEKINLLVPFFSLRDITAKLLPVFGYAVFITIFENNDSASVARALLFVTGLEIINQMQKNEAASCAKLCFRLCIEIFIVAFGLNFISRLQSYSIIIDDFLNAIPTNALHLLVAFTFCSVSVLYYRRNVVS